MDLKSCGNDHDRQTAENDIRLSPLLLQAEKNLRDRNGCPSRKGVSNGTQ